MSDHKTTQLNETSRPALPGNLPGNPSQKTRIRIAPWEAADFKSKDLGEIRTETGFELETQKEKHEDAPCSREVPQVHSNVARQREGARTREDLNSEGCNWFCFPRRRSSENRR